MMTPAEYHIFVERLIKPGSELKKSMTPEQLNALHMAVGVAGEAGELLDAVKKYAIYNKPADLENIIEELGDLEFYMQGIRNAFLLTRDQCIAANMAKLGKRYAEGTYSDRAAIAREDKE